MTTETKAPSFGVFLANCIASFLFFPTVTLLAAGNWLWVEGWLFGLWFDAMVLSSMIYMYRHDPALLAERAKAPGSDNQKTWDKYLLTGIYLMAIIWFVVMPLDSVRFGCSPPIPLWAKVLGGAVLLPALYLIYQATAQNTYLSTLVRIQDDRAHQVITTGVYSFVRHPLYLGCVFMMFGAGLLLGSLVGLGIGVFAIFVLVFRINGEEKMLIDELKGYTEYQQKVRYRLFPLVW